MRRVLIIVALGVAAILTIAAAACGFLFWTPPGRAALVSLIEPRLGAALGGEATIGALEGAPPRRIVLREIVLSSGESEWLRVARLELDWDPFVLLSGAVDIERLDVDGATLLNTPPQDAADKEGDAPPSGFTFPERLPHVAVRSFALNDAIIGGALLDAPVTLDASGSVRLGGGAFDVAANVSSDDGRDRLDATLQKIEAANRLVIDLEIASAADGAIATLAGLDGALNLTAKGDAPLDDFRATIAGEIGAYGALDGRLSGDLRDATTVRYDGAATFGPALAAIAEEVGPAADMAVTLSTKAGAGALDIERLAVEAGEFSGRITWRNRNGALHEADLALRALLAEGYRPEIAPYIGRAADVRATLTRQHDDYRIEGGIDAAPLSISVADGETDLRETFSGSLAAILAADDGLPPAIARGGEARGRIDVAGRALRAEGLNVALSGGTSFDGEASADLDAETFSLTGAGRFSAEVARLVLPSAAFSGPISADMAVNGAFDRFEATFDADLPAFVMNETKAPAMTIDAKFVGLPSLPTGDIKARALDGSRQLDASIRSSVDGRIAVPSLLARGPDFTLRGAGAYDPNAERATIDVVFEGGDNGEPWPGFPLSGSATAKGAIGRNGASRLDISAPALASRNFSVVDLDVTAEGPPQSVTIVAAAKSISLQDAPPIADLSLSGVADIRKGVSARIDSFNALIDELPASLSAPARIAVVDDIAIEGLRARVGRAGVIALDARLSDRRWRATLEATQAPVRAASAVADVSLDLDTDREIPATGTISVSSRLIEEGTVAVTADFQWTGRELRVVNQKPGDAIDADLRLPLTLARSPKLSVVFKGPIAGSARYAGPAEAIAAYLPSSLQSLEGDVEATVDVSGTTDEPSVTGVVTLANGAYTEYASGLSIASIEARAVARPSAGGSTITLEAAARGPGQAAQTIAFNGGLRLGEPSTIDATIRLDGARVQAGPVNEATGTGELRLEGALDAMTLAGAITLDEIEAELEVPETTGLVPIEVKSIGPGAETADAVPAPGPPPPSMRLDFSLAANDRVFIRGRGLDSEWTADLEIEGEASEPLVLGVVELRRGFLDFSGRRFTLTRGRIDFDRLNTNNPSIDIRAEYETGEGVLAAIEIKGRGQNPRVTLASTPALPQEDIMALVLFGKPATELSALESLQMAQALAQLGGVGPFGGGNNFAREALGLDMLNVDFDSETGTGSLEVGKYVADGLFVSATQDARGENGAVRLQYEISRSITVETEIKQTGDQTVSANWKRDF